jgi:hypothetical protein
MQLHNSFDFFFSFPCQFILFQFLCSLDHPPLLSFPSLISCFPSRSVHNTNRTSCYTNRQPGLILANRSQQDHTRTKHITIVLWSGFLPGAADQARPVRHLSRHAQSPGSLGSYKPSIRLVFTCNTAQAIRQNAATRHRSTLGQ